MYGSYVASYTYKNILLGIILYCCIEVKISGPQEPTEDVINPLYHTITDHHFEKPVISHYAEVLIPPEVKMTPNPAYAVP